VKLFFKLVLSPPVYFFPVPKLKAYLRPIVSKDSGGSFDSLIADALDLG